MDIDCLIAPGFGYPVSKIIGAGGDVCSAEVVLFVYLYDAVFLVVIRTGGQENGRCGAVVFQDTGFGGRGLG